MEENNLLDWIPSMFPKGVNEKLDFSIFGKMLSSNDEETPFFDQTAQNMFPEEFLSEENQEYSDDFEENNDFIPSMFPESMERSMGEMGIIPKLITNDSAVPDFDLLSGMNMNNNISEEVLKKIEAITSFVQDQNTPSKKMPDQLGTYKPTFNPSGTINVMDKKRKISASMGYDEDIKIFLGNIKNPPEWRVLN